MLSLWAHQFFCVHLQGQKVIMSHMQPKTIRLSSMQRTRFSIRLVENFFKRRILFSIDFHQQYHFLERKFYPSNLAKAVFSKYFPPFLCHYYFIRFVLFYDTKELPVLFLVSFYSNLGAIFQ